LRIGKYDSIRFKTEPELAAKFFKSEDFDILGVVIQIANKTGAEPAQTVLTSS
tara:strand:- start:227 stop:385 length:159 start_codon:yes stop_codon:yes gene_type:complete